MKIMLELTPKKKVGEKEMLFFPWYRISVNSAVVPLKFSTKLSQARQTGTENLFQPSKQKGSIGVVLAKQCENRTEFVALVDGNKDITSAVLVCCMRFVQ